MGYAVGSARLHSVALPTDICPGKMLESSPAPHSGYYYLDFSDEEQGHLKSHGQKKAKPQAKVCPGLFRVNYDMTPLCCLPHRTGLNLTLVWDVGF